MTSQYLSEIRIMPFNFAPRGWAQCNGQILAIQQNQALFALLGTTFGGNGVTTYALPDLRGRVPLGFNGQFPMGTQFGEAVHTLVPTEIPTHNHFMMVDAQTAPTSSTTLPSSSTVLGQTAGTSTSGKNFPVLLYNTAVVDTRLASQAIAPTGGQAHENRQPFLTLNFCIALTGIFPSRN